ncbi:right-handed parallel beta-helix repeat-containing protein [Sulfurimonas sp. HSL-3221]|uniref:glycosyl hydrolase family 28-related protein n=1 Tax=Thiomicrolovo sulfuroxydans TaxID=2894755 RepID=UPI001E5D97D6|nr:glycosyl hydrolase family 28-related protein [Sulfurimonas sp. HSL-3221]UFS62264.1 right-handed parallel beta-helix repeat-containing protein [Sulfurimonas sp. HSL-3221]
MKLMFLLLFNILLYADGVNTIIDVASKAVKTKPLDNMTVVSSIPIANVVFFGAVGDGITNDTSAIENAMRNASTIYIPKGVYVINKMNIPSHVYKIYGEGTILSTDKYGAIKQEDNIDKLEISGLTWIFDKQEASIHGMINMDSLKSYKKNIVITNNVFIGAYSVLSKPANALLFAAKGKNGYIENLKITNNKFIDITRAGIEIVNMDKNLKSYVHALLIKDNVFIGHKKIRAPWKKTIFQTAISLAGVQTDCEIIGNYIKGFKWGIEIAGTAGTIIKNNIIYAEKKSISISETYLNSKQIRIPVDTKLIDNLLDASGLRIQNAQNIFLRHNRIKGTIYLRLSNGVVITENNISSDNAETVSLENSSNTEIMKNDIYNTRKSYEAEGVVVGHKESDSSNHVFDNNIYLKRGKIFERNTKKTKIEFKNNKLFRL